MLYIVGSEQHSYAFTKSIYLAIRSHQQMESVDRFLLGILFSFLFSCLYARYEHGWTGHLTTFIIGNIDDFNAERYVLFKSMHTHTCVYDVCTVYTWKQGYKRIPL